MKENGRYYGQIRCYNERSTRCSSDRLHPRLQPQTQAYPARATRTLFAVIPEMISNPLFAVFTLLPRLYCFTLLPILRLYCFTVSLVTYHLV